MKAADDPARIRAVAARFDGMRGALLPMLHAVNDELGHVSDEAVAILAEIENLTRAEVHGVLSFYHDFRRSAPGRHIVKVCRAESCQSMGAESLIGHIKARLSADLGQTSADGAFTLEEVFCLGNCALSPALSIDGRLYGRMTARRFDILAKGIEEGEPG